MTTEDSSICVIDSFKQLEAHVPVDRISKLAPIDYHQNNASLFKLARLVKSYEHAIDRCATPQELEVVFDRWSADARLFWRPELTRDDYYSEFLEIYSYIRIGLDEDPIELAFKRASIAPLPDVPGFTDERIRRLASICREMHEITGGGPFFLPTRKLGNLFAVHFSMIARWLRTLEVLGIIHLASGEVRKSGGNRSPRHNYGKPVQEGAAVAITASPQPVLLPNADHFYGTGRANHDETNTLSLSRDAAVRVE